MDKRFSRLQSGKLLAAAVASVGLAGWASHEANAGLVIDVRATGATAGTTFTAKSVQLGAGLVTVTMGVFARLSGTNATQQVGEFGGGLADDTRNDDTLQTVVGSFNSVGTLLGNMTGNAAGVGISYNSRTSPFNAGGSTNGVGLDWDSDGDLDIGQASTDPTNLWSVRASAPSAATLFNGTTAPTKGWSNGPDGSAQSGAQANDTIIDPTTQELMIGTIRFIVNGAGNGANANVNYVQRTNVDLAALWFEDGIATSKSPTSSPFSTGTPVGITNIPEPATLGLLGVASLGLLARRRNKNA